MTGVPETDTVVGVLKQGERTKQRVPNERTILEAVRLALARVLEEDENVLLFGEDVGVNGGVFRVTEGLQRRFGEHRVFDTPLAESMLIGTAVGMAAMGLRPVVEIQFMGFCPPALDQVLCHAARLRNRTEGVLSCPLVIRMPYGGGIHAPEHHSESTEALFAHLPGIRVVVPSSPKRAYGLLLAAVRDPDPVVFLEPKREYRSFFETVEDDGIALPLDTSFVLREGDALTLVSWGAMMRETLEAARVLETSEGRSADVVDVATLGPTFDFGTILRSVEKTGRCVIVHEATLTGGFGAEIAARLADEGLTSLQAPVKRVTAYDTVMPLPRMEHLQMPTAERVLNAARHVLSF